MPRESALRLLVLCLAASFPAAAPAPCSEACGVCGGALAPPGAATLYTPLVRDGAGSIVAVLVDQARYASARGFRWGGAVATRRSQFAALMRPADRQPHHVDPLAAIAFFFGRAPVVRERPPRDALVVASPAALAALDAPSLGARDVFYANARAPLPALRTENATDDERFLRALRAGAACRVANLTTRFEAGKLAVAVHLRRGDVVETMRRRWVSAECVVKYAAWIRGIAAKAAVKVDGRVFSSVSRDAFRRGEWTQTSFDGLRGAGLDVVLADDTDGGDVTEATLDALAHMASARVLLVGASNFSRAAAALNPHCVLYPAPADGGACYRRDAAARRCVWGALRGLGGKSRLG